MPIFTPQHSRTTTRNIARKLAQSLKLKIFPKKSFVFIYVVGFSAKV